MDATPSLLGANAAEYSRPMEPGLEAREFDWARLKRARVLAMLRGLGPIRTAADIGCRSGREAAWYRDEAGIATMHGFEIAADALPAAAARGLVTHVWISGQTACPVQDASFNAVTALDVIEHLFDTDSFLAELHRVIVPGGHLLLSTPNLAWWWNRLRLLAGRAPAGMGGASPAIATDPAIDLKHLRVHPPAEWIGLARRHGFTCAQSTGYTFPGLLRGPFNALDTALAAHATLAHSALLLLRRA